MKVLCYTFNDQEKNITKGTFIMDSITHINNLIKSFSSNSFIFSSYIEPLFLLNHIPDSISYELNNVDFIHHLNEALKHLEWLNPYFQNNINPLLKKELKKLKPSPKKDSMVPYADFKIDEPPIFKEITHEQLSFEDILKASPKLKPIKRRSEFKFEGTCPFCGAPHDFIYDNNGKGRQFKCKICKNTFTTKTTIADLVKPFCPHCQHQLSMHHDRKGYFVYVCTNHECSYYQANKAKLDKGDPSLKTSSGQDRLRYHYRDFKFNLKDLRQLDKFIDGPVDLSRIHFDLKVLGLALTYYVNYGLSTRKTALILKEVHGIKISHKTIKNYATTVSNIIKPLIDKYPYQLSNILTGDETYIKVRGKNQYVFFWSDPEKKIITSYTIYPVRDTKCACQSIADSLSHYKEIPEDLHLITDGNPIYNAAQLFFHVNDINFQLTQVIGVKNKDEVSSKYRPYKQIEERLNRTYKQNYYGTNGYDTLDGANTYMVLYVAFFNFLRQHSALNYKCPVELDCFKENVDMRMQDRWLQLIELSKQYHIKD